MSAPRSLERRYASALRALYALAPRGIRLELGRMRRALAALDHPERAFESVHVAGTNGKGSVSASLAEVLRRAGHRTGLFTSPHLHRFTERIRVNGREVGRAAFLRAYDDVRDALEAPRMPEYTFFEWSTLLAFVAFRRARVSHAVVEVGLGGRFDATNVITPRVSIITNVALDHTEWLGPTIARIAREKAGILKRGVGAVVGPLDEAAARVVGAQAERLGAEVWEVGGAIVATADDVGRVRVTTPRGAHGPLHLALRGAHQVANAACVVGAVERLRDVGTKIPERALREGLAHVTWPGRFEIVGRSPEWIFDAAHNPDGCAALRRALEALRPRPRRVLVFAAMRDKDVDEMLRELAGCFDEHIYFAPRTSRALDPSTLAARVPGHVARSAHHAVGAAKRLASRSGRIVVAGSIYGLSEIRAIVCRHPADPIVTL